MSMRSLPLFPLKTVLFPGMPLPLVIFEERYKALFRACLKGDRRFGVVLLSSDNVPLSVGTVAYIVRWEEIGKGHIRVLTVGEQRFRVLEHIESEHPFPVAVVEFWEDEESIPAGVDPHHLLRHLPGEFIDYLTMTVLLSGISLPVEYFNLPSNPSQMSFYVARSLQVDLTEKQRLLEEPSTVGRLQRELMLVRRERDFLQRLFSLQGIAGEMDERLGLRWHSTHDWGAGKMISDESNEGG
ncbi:MAG: LON peptidase substrate-binding domain-containing protein [Anaerolineae bacterium]|nr:LON peptidase substrate-binding domain-containing protein [Anaerolineae bacterium]MDW8072148.1 LON peptidase substrate-binding domain-containing protein [Anaerolineae bacterium]